MTGFAVYTAPHSVAEEHYHQSDGAPGNRNAPPCTCPKPNALERPVMVWDVKADKVLAVSPGEAAAGMVRYARTLDIGSAACGEVIRQALELLRPVAR